METSGSRGGAVGNEVGSEPDVDGLRHGGRRVTAGAIAGPMVTLGLRRRYPRQRRLMGSTMHTPDDLAELAGIAAAGGVQPRLDELFRLEELHDAQRRFEDKAFVGKLVVARNGPVDG